MDMFQPQPRQEDVAQLFRSLGFRNLLERFAAFDRFSHLADAAASSGRPGHGRTGRGQLKGKTVAVAARYDDSQPIPAVTAPGHGRR